MALPILSEFDIMPVNQIAHDVLTFLRGKHGFPSPASLDGPVEKVFGSEFTPHWTADTAAYAIKHAIEEKMFRDPGSVPLVGDVRKAADVVFRVGLAANKLGANRGEVLNACAASLGNADEKFAQMKFATSAGEISGNELLHAAAKERFSKPALGVEQKAISGR